MVKHNFAWLNSGIISPRVSFLFFEKKSLPMQGKLCKAPMTVLVVLFVIPMDSSNPCPLGSQSMKPAYSKILMNVFAYDIIFSLEEVLFITRVMAQSRFVHMSFILKLTKCLWCNFT